MCVDQSAAKNGLQDVGVAYEQAGIGIPDFVARATAGVFREINWGRRTGQGAEQSEMRGTPGLT